MACLEGMTIQGIRSFGPEESDKGAVMFFTPLTLILGPNGTGKTTIIECLKYMTTGAMPPGAQKGGAFIHDPKIVQDTEVKAQVCLQFRDVRGQRCIAKRSVVATQKKTTIQMKTLDGFIKRTLPNGEIADISSKCAEMDREMVSLLGVSHAILDNVIFCHQEESNWPLSEGSALKKKFDDIFASTRYVKALEAIRKFRLEQAGYIREYQAEIKYLKQNKDKAGEIRSNLADREERHRAAADSVRKLQEKLEPVEEKLVRLKDKEDEIQDIKNKIDILKGGRTQMERSQRELRAKIKQEFKESTTELGRQIEEFTEKVTEMEKILKQNREKLDTLEKEMGRLGQDKSRLQAEQGRLQAEAERHTNVVRHRDDKVKKLSEKYSLTGYASHVNDDSVRRLLVDLEERARSVLTKAQGKRTEHDSHIERVSKEIDKNRQAKTKLETEQQMKLDRLKANQLEIRKMNAELSRVDASAGKLVDIDRDINRIEMEFTETQKATDLEALKVEIQQLQKEKLSMDSNLKQLDNELNQLTQEATTRTQLEVFCKDKTSKEDQIRRLKAKNEDTLRHVLGTVPEEACGKALEKYIRDHNGKVRSATDILQKLRSKLTMLETTRKMENNHLSKKQEELRGFVKQINDTTQGVDFDTSLDTIQNKLKGHNDQKGHLTAIEYLFKKYIEKLRATDPNCPLCHRPFDEQAEVTELIEEMENKLVSVPSKLDKLTSSINESKHEYENLLQLKPKRDMIKERQDKDIPHLESTIQSLNADIQSLQEEISEKDEELEADSNDETVAKSLLPDVMQIDRLMSELSELNRRIEVQTSKLSSDSRRTLQEVQAERSNLQLQMDQVTVRLEHKRQSLFHQTEQMQKLRTELNDLRSSKVQIESELQQRSRLEQNKEELITANEVLETEVEEAKHQVQPIQDKIESLVEEKERVVQTREEQYERGKEEYAEVRDCGKTLQDFQSEIDRYVREGKADLLSASRARAAQVEEEMSKLEQRRTQLSDSIDRSRQELAAQEINKRDLEDNLQLRKNQEEIETACRRIEGEEERLGGIRVDNLTREKADLKREYEKLERDKDAARSRQQVLEGEIVAFQRDLNEDMYKDAEEKYRLKRIALRTTELANSDLDKYYKALDGTIMSYHNQKMTEINKIISELWRNTYRGNDIDTIQIRSDDDTDEGSGASKTRRQYRYRVVMMKVGTELDMRGRCSAGQKVLASLIIRLALAETFCLNFGVLALDEPTTNLDRENIISLASALDKIIRSRSRQRNFQLIVITHDEDFLELLGRADHADEFFKVQKTNYGCSRLVRAKIQDVRGK